MNSLFQRNIEALSQKNMQLAMKLQQYIPTDVPQIIQENGVYNLFYKNQYIHNRQNPLGEANEIFSRCTNEPVSIHLIYGLGLGYLFQLFSLKSKGTVILYEPDLNVLKIVFTLVDFSKDILKENVFIFDNVEQTAELIHKKSGMDNLPQMLSLPSQRNYDNEGFDNLVRKLQELIGSFKLDLKYTKEKFYPLSKMLIQNLPNVLKEKPLIKLKDKLRGKTAVVVSAGPTLDRNIETIKKYRKNIVLFVVGTALKTIVKNEITPDFVVIIESFNSSNQLEGLDTEKVNFITEPTSHPALRKFNYKNAFTHISSNTPINHFLAEITGENIDEYLSKGTVSYTALNCARILGCSKIVIVGQDLAYIEGQCYSKNSAYKDLICSQNIETGKWEITAKDFDAFASSISTSPKEEVRIATAKRRLKNLNNSLYSVKSIQGGTLPTESVYAAFIRPLSEYTQLFNDREYINTSLVGAQIDGFKNMSLEEALKDTMPVGNLDLSADFEYKKDDVWRNFELKIKELKEAKSIIEDGKKYLKSMNNDLNRYKTVNVDILKTLKKLSLNYLSLSGDFAAKSKLFDFITIAEKIDLDYEMKMTEDFNYTSVRSILEKINLFYNNAEKKINEICLLAEKAIKE